MALKKIGGYEVLAEIGRGGMGIVYRARPCAGGEDVALKLLPGDLLSHAEALRRFRREVETMMSLQHPGLVRILDLRDEEGLLFYTMDLLRGVTLKERIVEVGRADAGEVLLVARRLAETLDYLHGREIIHRDIKPHNVMLCDDGAVKLMDFGLVKALDRSQITQGHKCMGTPNYMPPETVHGETANARSDIYQLGLVLHEMATGQTPFSAPDVLEIVKGVLVGDLEHPSEVNGRIPVELGSFILACCEKDPALRYEDPKAVLAVLEKLEERAEPGPAAPPWADPALAASAAPSRSPEPPPGPTRDGAPSPQGQRGPWWIPLLIVTAALLAVFTLLY